MLAYILAVLVGTGSVGLYISAFFFPEIHRKHDFIWSGVGFFYALVLWIYARQETGGILVGQTASVALLGWFAWQTLKLRRQLVPVSQQTPIPSTTKLKEQLGLKQSAPNTAKPTAKISTPAISKTPAIPSPAKTTPIQPPFSQEATQIESHAPKPIRQVSPPVSPNPVAEDEAWIKLEVKPAPTPSKPLGTAVQPPSPPPKQEKPPAPAIIPETISTNVPSDAIQTQAQLNSEDRE
jgi:Ycf66 protein N-terminus